ncbi:hypothetical protein WN51_04860 [Melipona quadrifasciata]|uniref:Uncharacterized protein n=1 Tax=Melipona quadrifasciata TaxID=166423 RepID=A0A0M8ZSA5_9HYME|nr:hypothetical protein WN51_04860 [Melipona quadrifasciata]
MFYLINTPPTIFHSVLDILYPCLKNYQMEAKTIEVIFRMTKLARRVKPELAWISWRVDVADDPGNIPIALRLQLVSPAHAATTLQTLTNAISKIDRLTRSVCQADSPGRGWFGTNRLQRVSSNLCANFQVGFDAVAIGNVQDTLVTREISTENPRPFQVYSPENPINLRFISEIEKILKLCNVKPKFFGLSMCNDTNQHSIREKEKSRIPLHLTFHVSKMPASSNCCSSRGGSPENQASSGATLMQRKLAIDMNKLHNRLKVENDLVSHT